eukprot:12416729-Karenia_brevis.AAC.1
MGGYRVPKGRPAEHCVMGLKEQDAKSAKNTDLVAGRKGLVDLHRKWLVKIGLQVWIHKRPRP